ncbi:hypothetical protein ACOZ4Y_04670 [Komagataeibacter rhaeticus]
MAPCGTLDRTTGARFSITPQTIDNVLYDSSSASARSRPSITQSNQYRVILEATPSFQQDMASLNQIYLPGISGNAGEILRPDPLDPSSGLVPHEHR